MLINFATCLFLISSLFFENVSSTSTSKYCRNVKVNVKTVLWEKKDTCRKCWGTQDLLKAYARRVIQDLLPRRVPRNIPLLLQYLSMTWEQVQKKTAEGSTVRYVLTLAVSDTIGGYLQAIALPIANEAYYAGNVDYRVVAQLYYLFEEIKMELGTDGGGWAKPCDMNKIPTSVSSLDLSQMCDAGDPEACSQLHIPVGGNSSTCNGQGKSLKELNGKIPLPFLDDDQNPHAIAIPIKAQLLWSLDSMSSANILVEYYLTAVRCIGKKDKGQLLKFNHAFYHWIIAKVAPHLHEKNKWYVGFGSVMRIIETMHQKGWSPSPECPGCENGDYGKDNGGGAGGGIDNNDGSNNILTPTPLVIPQTPSTGVLSAETILRKLLLLVIPGVLFFLLFCWCFLFLLRRWMCGEEGFTDASYVPFLDLYRKYMEDDELGDGSSQHSDIVKIGTPSTVETDDSISENSVPAPKELAADSDTSIKTSN